MLQPRVPPLRYEYSHAEWPREQLSQRLEGSSRLSSRPSSGCFGPSIVAPGSMTATSFLLLTARESETFSTLRTEYKVLRAAIAYISRSQGEDDEFKSVWRCHPSRQWMDQWRRMRWRRRWRRLSAYASLMLALAVI